jgi:hypothetical protein
MGVLTNGQMDELLDEQTPFRIYGQTNRDTDVQGKGSDKQTNIEKWVSDRWMDEQMDRQTEIRRTNRCKNTQVINRQM